MSGIAELCQRLGFVVSGCDLRETPVTTRLAELGVAVAYGHHPSHLSAELDAVVISAAVKFSNPEVAAARAAKIPVIPRAEMLGELLRLAKVGIAVAGTHG
ncbi:MAG TPA: Mur ligase domain-containing protein, partial [Stellaceae bacterium]|nr:Mur ligase domain-containing protein [Stellaceae bacterium]